MTSGDHLKDSVQKGEAGWCGDTVVEIQVVRRTRQRQEDKRSCTSLLRYVSREEDGHSREKVKNNYVERSRKQQEGNSNILEDIKDSPVVSRRG